MNSCMYDCRVMHSRHTPKKHEFVHRLFNFYLDLDEIDVIARNITLISRNWFNLHGFYDKDHLQYGGNDVKENVLNYIRQNGITQPINKIMLMTSMRVLGYVFNPASFYYCFDEYDQPLCVVVQVCNTFREMKMFFLGPETFKDGKFLSQQTKYFYVSPYNQLTDTFDFKVALPGQTFRNHVDVVRDGRKFFYAAISGEKKELTNENLWWYNLRYPWVTLKVIFLIHMHGVILLLKGVPLHWKHERPDLQKDVQRSWRKTSTPEAD